MENIKFSIVCPLFNKEKYILDAIDSVIEQTYNNWELIIIDDESTDKSFEVAKSRTFDRRIKLIKEKRQGTLLSRYYGASISDGNYLLFLDADDMLEPYTLDILFNYIVRIPRLDFIRFKEAYMQDDGSRVRGRSTSYFYFKNEELFDDDLRIYKEHLLKQHINYITHLCIRKDKFPFKYDFAKYSKSNISEDLIMQLVLTDSISKGLCIDHRLYLYRKANNSMITSKLDLDRLENKMNPYELRMLVDYSRKWDLFNETKDTIFINSFYKLYDLFINMTLNYKWCLVKKTLRRYNLFDYLIGKEFFEYIYKVQLSKSVRKVCKYIYNNNYVGLYIYYLRLKFFRHFIYRKG